MSDMPATDWFLAAAHPKPRGRRAILQAHAMASAPLMHAIKDP